jgi:hypothetical protein
MLNGNQELVIKTLNPLNQLCFLRLIISSILNLGKMRSSNNLKSKKALFSAEAPEAKNQLLQNL